MTYCLNELSLGQTVQNVNEESILREFIAVCAGLKNYRFEKIKVPNGFPHLPIVNNVSIAVYLNQNAKSDISLRLKDILSNRIETLHDQPMIEELKSIEEVSCQGVPSELLTYAHLGEKPLVSFSANAVYNTPVLQITITILSEACELQTVGDTIVNFSLTEHLTNHKDYLETKRIQFIRSDSLWDASKTPFTLTVEMAKYLNDSKYNPTHEELTQGERIALYIKTGTHLALMNGWEEDEKISEKNSSKVPGKEKIRRVFRSKGRKLMFLSIDVRHGEFELLNEKGIHQAVYSFQGMKIEKAVEVGTHDIIV